MEISSVSNPRVKGIAALHMKKERLETGLFVVEGLQLVGFGVEAGWELVTLVASGKPKQQIFARAAEVAKEILEVTPEVMAKVSRKDNPQAVLGVFRQRMMRLEEFGKMLTSPPCADGLPAVAGRDGEALIPLAARKNARSGVAVVLEEVRDPGNLGTIIRTVDAVGAEGVMLVGETTDVWAPECVRATMGSVFHVPVVKCSREAFLKWRAGFGGQVVGTHLRGDTDYRKVPPARPLLLCMGTEQSGLSEEMAKACTALVRISMRGRAESLNLAMATGVLLYEVERASL